MHSAQSKMRGKPLSRGRYAISQKKATRKANNKARKKAAQPKFLFIFKLSVLVALVGLLLFLANILYSSWAHRVWDAKTRITIVVADNDPTIYSYDPQSGKLFSITIPKNTQVDTSSGYGQWLAGSLWRLGKQEKVEGDLMRLSLQKSLQIPVDAWTDPQGEDLFKSHSLGWISSLWEAFKLSKIKSNLTFFDRANLLFNASKVGVTDRKNIDLESVGVIKKTNLSDGEAGYVIIPERAKVTLDILRDTLVYAEAKKVVVENATGKNGIAGDVAQISAILGARVIGAENSDENITDCVIRGEAKQLSSVTAKRLMQVFACKKDERKLSGPEDLEILLGRDFKDRF